MKFLFDLFPVALFFSIFEWAEMHATTAQGIASRYLSPFVSGGTVTAAHAPILLATALAIIASIAQIGILLVRRKKIDVMLWMSLIIVGFFGGMTIYFDNDIFIKLKPTVLYWSFAVALSISQFIMKKNLIRTMMEKQISLPEPVWQRLSVAWITFFAAMGCINLYVAFVLFKDNSAAWVHFKAFGATGLMIAFVIGQTFFLSKYVEEQK